MFFVVDKRLSKHFKPFMSNDVHCTSSSFTSQMTNDVHYPILPTRSSSLFCRSICPLNGFPSADVQIRIKQ